MDITELKKIILDQKNKLKALDQADLAISQLEGMDQAVSDYTKRIENLKKEELKLKEYNAGLDGKNKQADYEIEQKITKGNQTAAGLVDKANEKAKEITSKALNDLSRLNSEINAKQDAVSSLDEKKKALEIELREIEGALGAAREKLAILMK